MFKKKKDKELNIETDEKVGIAGDSLPPKEKIKVNVKDELMLDMFIGDYKKTSGQHNSYAAGFKAWFLAQDEENIYKRNSKENWIKDFEKYLSSPVKEN